VLLTPSTYQRIRDVAEVGPPVPVELKGISEPLLLYELRGLGGRYGRRLPDPAAAGGPEVPVALPLACWVIDGKAVRSEAVFGTVMRLGLRVLEAQLDAGLDPLTNVRVRLRYPEPGQESADLYGKVRAAEPAAGGYLVRIDLTSVDASDQVILERLVRGSGAPER
jgi:hypothetical protein